MTMMGIISAQTCGEACWYAKEDVCRCSCGGAMHGQFKVGDGQERPGRTKRSRGIRYDLVAVCDDYSEAWDFMNAHGVFNQWRSPLITNSATKSPKEMGRGQSHWFQVPVLGMARTRTRVSEMRRLRIRHGS